MAKNIRWQIPFVSIQGVHYRVDIYDEGIFTPVQLTAGPTPFVTDEDASDDFFCPVRSQSGTLQVCTLKPDGTYITLDELLPANNIARPVRLINLDNSNAIEWQGFLSCEAYSQDYTGIPQILDIPINSVLEALKSVEIAVDEEHGFLTILGYAALALQAIEQKVGMSLFNDMYIADYYGMSLTLYLYKNVFLTSEDVVNGDFTTIETHSISCKDILERIAKFIGGSWREYHQDIYLSDLGQTAGYSSASFANIVDHYINPIPTTEWSWEAHSIHSLPMKNAQWIGTDHKQNLSQGYRRIKVIANLKGFLLDMSLMETPKSPLAENPSGRQPKWGEVSAFTNNAFNSLETYRGGTYTVKVEQDTSHPTGKKVTFTKGTMYTTNRYNRTWFWENDEYLDHYDNLFLMAGGEIGTRTHRVMTFPCWMRVKTGQDSWQLKSGLMLYGLPNSYKQSSSYYVHVTWPSFVENDYIYKQQSALPFAAGKGNFKFSMEFDTIVSQLGSTYVWNMGQTGEVHRGFEMAIKWGDKYALLSNGSWSWVNYFTTFAVRENTQPMDGQKTFEIPINSFNSGYVSMFIYPHLWGAFQRDGQHSVHGLFISKLNLHYVYSNAELQNDIGSNKYMIDTGQPFADELSVELDIASDANNSKLETMIWKNETKPASTMMLGQTFVRPEVDLLERLATYYGASRKRLELKVGHPTVSGTPAPLPLLKLKGINENKIYLPLSENRDWQTEVCTLTCFETPELPAES